MNFAPFNTRLSGQMIHFPHPVTPLNPAQDQKQAQKDVGVH